MKDILRKQLQARGWKPGRYKGFLEVIRAGIEFQVGQPPASDRLELRYRYQTARTNAEGEVLLPEDTTMEKIDDAIAAIYLQVHENPDYRRVFGGKRRLKAASSPGEPSSSPEDTQQIFDL